MMKGFRHSTGLKTADVSLAYMLLRIVIGINFFNHGVTRLGNIPGFADAMVNSMEGAWMPEAIVRATAFVVPPVELIVGLCLVLGLFTRLSLIVTFVLMATFMYGATIVQNWDLAASQLIYTIVLFILLACAGYNRFALDNVLFKGDRMRNDRNQPSNLSKRSSERVTRVTRSGLQ